MQTFRRLRAALLAVWFAWWSVLSPVTVHAATYSAASNLTGRMWYVPMQGTGIAGAAVVATAATALGRANPWIAAITLGMPIAEYLLELKNGSKVAVAPANALQQTPPGWTDSNTPPATATGTQGTTTAATATVNPAATPRYKGSDGACTSYFDSPEPAIKSCLNSLGWAGSGTITCPTPHTSMSWCSISPEYTRSGYPGVGSYNYNRVWACPSGTINPGTGVCTGTVYSCPGGGTLSGTSCIVAATCPSGYAVSASGCTLTDSPKVKWPSDGIATLTTDPTGLPMFASDRDPDPLPLGVTVTEIQNGTQLTGLDPFGNYQFTQITPQPGGGLKVDQGVQLTASTPSAQTTTTYNSVTTNNVGAVTDTSTKTVIGSITNTTSSSTPATTLPDDYNREVTQKAIETELKAASAQAMPDQAQRLTDAATENKTKADAFEEQIKTGQGSDKSLWFSWVWTPPVGECSASVGSVHDVGLSLDYCGPVNLIRDVVGWLFALFGAVEVYGQLFRRQS